MGVHDLHIHQPCAESFETFVTPDPFISTPSLFTASASARVLTAGTHTFQLQYPGGVISEAGADSPLYLRNLVPFDCTESQVLAASEAAPYTVMGPFDADLFAPGPLQPDGTEYRGAEKTVITLKDQGANMNPSGVDVVHVKVVSAADPRGGSLGLTETGPDTGEFTGQPGFRFGGSDSASGLIAPLASGIVQVFYDDADFDYRWIKEVVWYSGIEPGDLEGSGDVDLADAVRALHPVRGTGETGRRIPGEPGDNRPGPGSEHTGSPVHPADAG